MEDPLIQILKGLAISSPAAIITYILYKAGVLQAFASRIRKNGIINNTAPKGNFNSKLIELEKWQTAADENHFVDLKDLLDDRKEMWSAIRSLRKDLNDFQNKVLEELGYLKGKINGR